MAFNAKKCIFVITLQICSIFSRESNVQKLESNVSVANQSDDDDDDVEENVDEEQETEHQSPKIEAAANQQLQVSKR